MTPIAWIDLVVDFISLASAKRGLRWTRSPPVRRIGILACTAAMFGFAMSPTPVLSVTINDGDFVSGTWSYFTSVVDDPWLAGTGPKTSSGYMARYSANGNPGAFLVASHTLVRGDCIATGGVKTDYTYTPSVSGAINTISASADIDTHGSTAGWTLVLEQSGRRYYSGGLDYSSTTWTRIASPGAGLTAADFDTNPLAFAFTPVPDGIRPDFSASGGPIRFGFMVSDCLPESPGPVTATYRLDNLSVSIVSIGGPPAVRPPSGCAITADPPRLYAPGSVTLTASCTGGDPPTSYLWRSGSTTLGATGNQIVPWVSTTATFTVVASNAGGDSAAAAITINVVAGAPPGNCRITANPASLKAPGGTVTLTVSCATGNPPTSFRWWQGFADGKTTNPVTGQVSSTTSFAVIASNAWGSSDPVSITVEVVPPSPPSSCAITANPASLKSPGGTVTLSVACAGGDPATAYQWFGGLAEGKTTNPVSVPISSTTTFTAQAGNLGGWSDFAHRTVEVIDVVVPPTSCRLNADRLAVAPGGSVTLTASCAAGTPPFTYIWRAHGAEIARTSTPTLTRSDLSVGDLFSVEIDNAAAQNARPAAVRVYVTPASCRVSSSVPSPLPAGGGRVALTATCTQGDRPTSYRWHRDSLLQWEGHTSSNTFWPTVTKTDRFRVVPYVAGYPGTEAAIAIEVYVPPPPLSCLTIDPPRYTFPNAYFGLYYAPDRARVPFFVANACPTAQKIERVYVTGAAADVPAFVVTDGCTNKSLAQGSACEVDVGFVPKAARAFVASLVVQGSSGVENVPLDGLGYNHSNADDVELPAKVEHTTGDLRLPPGRTFSAAKPTVVLTHDLQVYATLAGPPAADELWTGFGARQAGGLLDQRLGDTANVLQYVWHDAMQGSLFSWPGADEYLAARERVRAAGEDLARQLEQRFGGLANVGPVHFIGHGLGAVVNAYAARRVLAQHAAASTASQFTILDFPSRVSEFPGLATGDEAKFGFDAAFFAAVLGAVQGPAKLRIDNYYAPEYSESGLGRAILGAAYNHPGLEDPFLLDGLFPGEGLANDHSGVQQWYRWTIDPNRQDYAQNARNELNPSLEGISWTWPPNGLFCQQSGAFTPPQALDVDVLDASLDPCGKGWSWSPFAQGSFPPTFQRPVTMTSTALATDTLFARGCTIDSGLLGPRITCPPEAQMTAQKATAAAGSVLPLTASNWGSGGVEVSVGSGNAFVPWSGRSDQAPNRFLAIGNNRVAGFALHSVAVSSAGTGESVAGAFGPVTIPADAKYLSLRVRFSAPTQGDVAVVAIDDVPVWSVLASSFADGVAVDSGPIPIAGLAGPRKFAVALHRVAGSTTTLQLENLASLAGGESPSAIEYYYPLFDHYFITAIPAEISALDGGRFPGWQRTAEGFGVYPLDTAGMANVCRFFSESFAPKSSHFYTPFATECAAVKAKGGWAFEGNVFAVQLPSLDGGCPPGAKPLYRLYNDGQGAAPNHRYTTSLATRSSMIGKGWIPEGYGAVGVIACVPE